MTLTKTHKKVTYVCAFLNNLFTKSNIPAHIGNPVALWLLDKVISNHVALDLTDELCSTAIKQTIYLDINSAPKSYIDAVVDYCIEKQSLFISAKFELGNIQEKIDLKDEEFKLLIIQKSLEQQICTEEPITERVFNAA